MLFKKGDKIRCIDDSPHASFNRSDHSTLELNHIYTVKLDQYRVGSAIKLEEIPYGWKSKRFIKANLTNEEKVEARRRAVCLVQA